MSATVARALSAYLSCLSESPQINGNVVYALRGTVGLAFDVSRRTNDICHTFEAETSRHVLASTDHTRRYCATDGLTYSIPETAALLIVDHRFELTCGICSQGSTWF